jgi:hypothetical protein
MWARRRDRRTRPCPIVFRLGRTAYDSAVDEAEVAGAAAEVVDFARGSRADGVEVQEVERFSSLRIRGSSYDALSSCYCIPRRHDGEDVVAVVDEVEIRGDEIDGVGSGSGLGCLAVDIR